jgi:folate-dependent phosphoribosylglycinamide formyltransferase PurN
VKIDLISVDPLAAIQLIYAAKTQDLEFDTVWIVGQHEQRCALLQEYSAIGRFALKFIADHHHSGAIENIAARGVDLALQVGSVMIRKALLEAPKVGVLNLHAGMLPRYRGLDSAMWAVLEGGVHGVSAHLLAAGVDTGPIVLTERVLIVPGESVSQLLARTHNKFKWQVFVRAACGLRDGTLRPRPQDPVDGRQYFALHPRLAAVAAEMLARV